MIYWHDIGFAVVLALMIDAVVGDPDWLWRRIPHPVALFGRAISIGERRLNVESQSSSTRKRNGLILIVVLILGAVAIGLALAFAARTVLGDSWAWLAMGVIGAMLIAQNSLYVHVARVRDAFATGGLPDARVQVGMIVGRDPSTLDEPGVVRASIETTAENFSDGVVAPVFWFLLFGLPGLFAYKLINTADSMIGYRNDRYRDFGWAAARIDDLANLIPARLSGVIIAVAGVCTKARHGTATHRSTTEQRAGLIRILRTMFADAGKHASPNAGWPESAMAAALGVALAGPRTYDGQRVEGAYLNAGGRMAPLPSDISEALSIFLYACVIHGLIVATVTLFAS
ncbi:MAG: adenosylcobinamide-phosphate synthase CbiB [Pseudomonadota bacterium]